MFLDEYSEGLDIYSNPKINQPKIILAKPARKIVGILNGIDENSCQFTKNMQEFSTLSFTVSHYIWDDDEQELISSNFYDSIEIKMELYLEGVGWFRINQPVDIEYSGEEEVKNVTADSIESELMDYDLIGFKINCGTEDSEEIMADGNSSELPTGVYIANKPITLYNISDTSLSLLHILLQYMKGWSIGTVDLDLWGKIAKFDVETTNLYSFLNNDISTAFECIVVFDYINFTINLFSLNTENHYNRELFKDTNTIINFRSLQDSVEMNHAEDLYTVYRVSGGENLNIRAVNFDENTIEDLSEFLNTKYVSQGFIDRYTAWSNYRESRRQDYINANITANNLDDKITYVRDRVPMTNTGSKITANIELTDKDEINYKVGVETTWVKMTDNDILTSYDRYSALKIAYEHLYVDMNGDFQIELIQASPDWASYKEVITYILPSLENEIKLRGISDKITGEGDVDYDYDAWMTDWDLYGVTELKNRIEVYNNNIEEFKSVGADKNTQPSDSKYSANLWNTWHELYLKDKTDLDSCKIALNTRQSELNNLLTQKDNIINTIAQIVQDVNVENQNSSNFRLTTDDLYVLWKLRNEVDYTNENIITTSMDTVETTIEHQKELLEDAQRQLAIYSHKQYSISINLDNLLAMYEYSNYIDDIQCGNYIRVMPTDNYQIKLRITSISYNPLIMENDLSLTFSNYLTSRNGRTDKASLLSMSSNIAKNSITPSTQSKGVDITDQLVGAILGSRQFQTVTTNIIGTVAGNVTVEGTISTDALVTKMAQITEAQIENLTSETAFIKYLNSNLVVAKAVKADSADIADLSTRSLTADSADIATLATESLTARTVKAENIDTSTLTTDSAFMQYLEANLITATEIDVDDLKAKLATINTLNANSAFVGYLQTLNTATINSVVNEQYVYDLVANHITVGDLAAGDITLSNQMRIVSANGKLIMNGTALQITGTDNNGDDYVGIQLGYDAQSNPSLILRNSEGATVLTPQGITSDAIADGLIVNNMVQNGTISKQKLSFQVIEPNAQGGIDITDVYDGSGGNFGTQYSTFKQGTEQALTNLDTKIDESATFVLYIDCPQGTNIKGGFIQLNARLFKNSVEVTDDYNASCFTWTRQSLDSYGDLYWNNQHSNGTKTITVTVNDVRMNADFRCVFEYDGTTVTSE